MMLEFSRQIFINIQIYSIKLHENSSGGSRVVRTDGRTDVTTLIVAFRNFAYAPKTKQLIAV